MTSASQILHRLQSLLPTLRQVYGVSRIGLFGSWIREEQRAESDIDILVSFQATPGMFTFLKLEEYLSQQLGVPVDLVMQESLKPQIGQRILEEVVMI
ncbi:MAG: nucleotidyltransferase family protein [Candidatus Kapaibacterium sp.]